MTPKRRTRSRNRTCSNAVYHRRRAALLLLISAALMIFVSVRSPAATTGPVAPASSLSAVVQNITAWIVGIVATVATLFLTIGGLRYVLASGEPGEVQKAKIALKSAMLGYGLAILAPTVMTVLEGFVSAGGR